MAPYSCSVCLDDCDSEETQSYDIDNSLVCRTCVDVEIVPLFQAALRYEYSYPPVWGGGVELKPNDFRDFLGDDFLERYQLQEAKYAVPDAQRRYCLHTLPNNEACSGMLLPAKPTLLDPGQYFTCDECKRKTCGTCELPVHSVQHACPGRPTDNDEDNDEEGEDAIDDRGRRGRDYQLCPRCGRVYALLEACNHVICKRKDCQTSFCIICGQECAGDSDHWMPGGCPRWNHPDDADALHDFDLWQGDLWWQDPPVEIGMQMQLFDDLGATLGHEYPRYEEIPDLVRWDETDHPLISINEGMEFDLNVRLTTLLDALTIAYNNADQAVPEWVSTNAIANHKAWVLIGYALAEGEENVVEAAVVCLTMCMDQSPHALEHDLDELSVNWDDTPEARNASILTAAVEEMINNRRVQEFRDILPRDDTNGRNILLDTLRTLGIDYIYRRSALGLITLREDFGFDAVPTMCQWNRPDAISPQLCYINIACDEMHRLWQRQLHRIPNASWANKVPGFIDNEKHEVWFHCVCDTDETDPDRIARADISGYTINVSMHSTFEDIVRNREIAKAVVNEFWDAERPNMKLASLLNQRKAGDYVVYGDAPEGNAAADAVDEPMGEGGNQIGDDAMFWGGSGDGDGTDQAPDARGLPSGMTLEQERQWAHQYGVAVGRLHAYDEARAPVGN